MNKLSAIFYQNKGLIPCIPLGDPSLEISRELIKVLAQGGADLINLVIPFSDPVAVSPEMEAAQNRALQGGITQDKIFEMLSSLREEVSIPLIFTTYANPIFIYGPEAFFSQCRATGVQGVIVQDLPVEEQGEFLPAADAHGVTLIPMVFPTSEDRIPKITSGAAGFVYCFPPYRPGEESVVPVITATVSQVATVQEIPCVIDLITSPVGHSKEAITTEINGEILEAVAGFMVNIPTGALAEPTREAILGLIKGHIAHLKQLFLAPSSF